MCSNKLAVLAFALLSAVPAFAQRTVVSGTVTDTAGLPYSGASLTVTLSLPTGALGAYLGGAQIAGTVGPVRLDSTGSFLLQLADNTQIQCANTAGQIVACAPQTKWSFSVNLSPGAPPPLGTGPQSCSATLTISGPSQSVSSSFSACPALSNVAGGGGLPAGGTVGQVIVNTGPGAGNWQDPNVSYSPVNLFNAVTATVTHTSANVKNPIYSQAGSLLLTFAGLTGVFTGCTLQLEAVDSLGNATNSGAAISIVPSNGTTSINVPVNASTTPPTFMPFIAAVYTCSSFGTGGTISLDFAGTTPAAGHGTGATTIGQWVQPGQALLTQLTFQNGFAAAIDLIVDVKILLQNGQVQLTRYEIPACNAGNVAMSGFAVTQGGWLQTWVIDINTAGFPQGDVLLNLYIANSLGSASTTTCGGSLLTGQIGTSLGTWMTGSFLPTGFIGTTGNITHPWTIPGLQFVKTQSNPAVGNDFAFQLGGPSSNGRQCVTAVNFFLTASATVATRTVALRIVQASSNGTVGVQPDMFFISPIDQTAGQLVLYNFNPSAITQQRTLTGNAGDLLVTTIPFTPGQICADAGTVITFASRIHNLQASDQITGVFMWVTQQHDND